MIREKDFYKRPGIAETLDWANALIHLHKTHLDEGVVKETLGCIFKHVEDLKRMKEEDFDSCFSFPEQVP